MPRRFNHSKCGFALAREGIQKKGRYVGKEDAEKGLAYWCKNCRCTVWFKETEDQG